MAWYMSMLGSASLLPPMPGLRHKNTGAAPQNLHTIPWGSPGLVTPLTMLVSVPMDVCGRRTLLSLHAEFSRPVSHLAYQAGIQGGRRTHFGDEYWNAAMVVHLMGKEGKEGGKEGGREGGREGGMEMRREEKEAMGREGRKEGNTLLLLGRMEGGGGGGGNGGGRGRGRRGKGGRGGGRGGGGGGGGGGGEVEEKGGLVPEEYGLVPTDTAKERGEGGEKVVRSKLG
ncbi:hypothetical protein NSK_008322 [Nannochloropsis salina CCMP1776]|uniref:Uncharacterized protein n=1 Tax=Nannochloropsis salina CCMP1776 TaxID=1027361 RepID=A0A4D9CMK0_9STRA|nr:hypothetical protein NSK_008322 [Nannochloropsis salina CCMP1776]|eukprot:TFJ80341.1 hypothetical protein NSK_008322 [Nannochloropsis salina CCMP1776]